MLRPSLDQLQLLSASPEETFANQSPLVVIGIMLVVIMKLYDKSECTIAPVASKKKSRAKDDTDMRNSLLFQLKKFPHLKVIGGKQCQSVSTTPAHGETWKIGERINVTALHTPCHTQDSICYFLEDGNQRAVFTGDTLFTGGTGDFFSERVGSCCVPS